MVKENHSWSEISRKLNLRTGCDCKDKYRNILRAEQRKGMNREGTVDKENLEIEIVIEIEANKGEPGSTEGAIGDNTLRRVINMDSEWNVYNETGGSLIGLGTKRGRKRRRWTGEEDSILLPGVSSGQQWVVIARGIPGRTNVDCKDRYRSITRKHGGLTADKVKDY